MTRTTRRHVLLNENLLDEAKTFEPLASNTAIVTEALKEWVSRRKLRRDFGEEDAQLKEAAAKLQAAYDLMTRSNTDTWLSTYVR